MKDFDFDLIEYLDEQGIRYKEASGGRQVILDACPRCGKSKKFYISVETGQFICHSCASRDKEMSGGAVKLLMLLSDLSFKEAMVLLKGKEVKLPKTDNELVQMLEELKPKGFSFFKDKKREYEKSRPESIKIPKFFQKITPSHPGFKYLLSRGLEAKDIEAIGVVVSKYSFSDQVAKSFARGQREAENIKALFDKAYQDRSNFSEEELTRYLKEFKVSFDLKEPLKEAHTSMAYRGRVIFPVWQDGKLYGWVARDFTGKSKLKVKNSAGIFKQFFVWNYDTVKASKELIIAEGIISAVKCGARRSIATLGKFVTDEQIQTLRGLKEVKEVYICLDPDAQPEAKELKQRLLPFFPLVYNVSLPKVKAVKCPHCQRKIEVDLQSDLGNYFCPLCTKKVGSLRLKELLLDADFKDAGDYSQAEMQKFIDRAKFEHKDDLLLKTLIFDE